MHKLSIKKPRRPSISPWDNDDPFDSLSPLRRARNLMKETKEMAENQESPEPIKEQAHPAQRFVIRKRSKSSQSQKKTALPIQSFPVSTIPSISTPLYTPPRSFLIEEGRSSKLATQTLKEKISNQIRCRGFYTKSQRQHGQSSSMKKPNFQHLVMEYISDKLSGCGKVSSNLISQLSPNLVNLNSTQLPQAKNTTYDNEDYAAGAIEDDPKPRYKRRSWKNRQVTDYSQIF